MRQRGSALLISLWALMLLAAAVFAWVRFLDNGITRTMDANLGLEAGAYARSGLAVALHPLVSPETPLLNRKLGDDRGYKVRLIGEGGKLNLNWILRGENPRKIQILKDLLYRRGLSFPERDVLVDCLLDWIDGDDLRRLNGMEDGEGYAPPNRGRLLDLSELYEIPGCEPLTSKSGWEGDFTLLSQGPIDLQSASPTILGILPGIGDARARRFVQIRRGPDKLDGTKDDLVLKDAAEAMSYLGLAQQQAAELQGLTTLRDPTYFIESVGYVGKVYRQLEVVARKQGAAPEIKLWKEL